MEAQALDEFNDQATHQVREFYQTQQNQSLNPYRSANRATNQRELNSRIFVDHLESPMDEDLKKLDVVLKDLAREGGFVYHIESPSHMGLVKKINKGYQLDVDVNRAKSLITETLKDDVHWMLFTMPAHM